MVGLLQDDILNDEIDIVKEAISRLSDHEAFERTFRIRRAMQLELSNSSLPEAEWTRYDQVCGMCNMRIGQAVPMAPR